MTEAQVGKQIRVLAAYADGHGTNESVSSASTISVSGYKTGTAGNDVLVGTAYADTLLGMGGNDSISGGAGNDTITGGTGDDTIDGGADKDVAVFSGTRSDYSITKNSDGSYAVKDLRASGDGSDKLSNVERLQFSDKSHAFDVSGSAGTVAKILGAVFGPSAVANKEWVGIGLSYIDGGMSYQDLMQLALNLRLGTGFTVDAEVTLLYQNLLNTAPSQGDLANWGATITSHQFSQASLAVMAADTSFNTTNINLVGLSQAGIEYS